MHTIAGTEKRIDLFVDCGTQKLLDVIRLASRFWDFMGHVYVKSPEFYYFQEDFTKFHIEELQKHETWLTYAWSKDFEVFEALLTFVYRLLFRGEYWEELMYISQVRAVHYLMKVQDIERIERLQKDDPNYWEPKW